MPFSPQFEQFSISVIIPVYNGEVFLAEAVASVERQHFEPLEIIVVDDGSTDGTAEVASGLNTDITFVRQMNKGAAAARNRGLSLARGNIIGFLDVDDLWTDNKLELQLTHFVKDPDLGIVMGYSQYMREVHGGDHEHRVEKFPMPWLVPNFGSALIRRSIFQTVGLLDEELLLGEDIDWFFRARELEVPILIHKEVVQYYRRHDQNMTNQMNRTRNYFARAVRKSLIRRRGKLTQQ
jgi:glycosyltransferase involved in cell wall biosynthesis